MSRVVLSVQAAGFNGPGVDHMNTMIDGAAHCATPLVFPGEPHDLFIHLPTSILCLGIQEVLLVGPYDYSFKSPLPAEKI
jgi:hypothetical protein